MSARTTDAASATERTLRNLTSLALEPDRRRRKIEALRNGERERREVEAAELEAMENRLRRIAALQEDTGVRTLER